MPIYRRLALSAALTAAGLLIAGCGATVLDLIPEPKQMPLKVTISGRVSDATNTANPVDGARVEVKGPRIWFGYGPKPNGETDHTGADGRYQVRSPQTDVSFDVDQAAGFTPLELTFELGEETETVVLDATLLPNTRTVKRVELSPPGPLTLAPGAEQQFTATLVDVDDNPMTDVTPTWAVSGDIGTIDASGLFTAGPHETTGSVIAALSAKMALAVVTVEAGTASLAWLPGRLAGIRDPRR
jgi:hypothetical protein